MASRRLFAAVALLSLVLPSSQFTRCEKDSCNLIGDPDLYGIGVRLSYYLTNLAGVLSFAFSNSRAVEDAKKGNAIIGFAILIVLIRNATLGALSIFEWYLVSAMIFFLVSTMIFSLVSAAFIPLAYMGNRMSFSALAIVYGLYKLLEPWVYFKLGDQGRKEGCELRAFFFTYFDFYNTHWIGFLKAMSILAAVAGAIFIVGGIYAFCREVLDILHHKKKAPEGQNGEPDTKHTKKPIARAYACMSIISFIIAIVFTEKLIQGNNVDLSEASLDSTSQLIPFLVGFFTFVSTLWTCIEGAISGGDGSERQGRNGRRY